MVTDLADAQNAVLWDMSFAVAFVLNSFVAELWIRATCRGSVLSARKVKAVCLRGSGFDQAAPRGAPVEEQ